MFRIAARSIVSQSVRRASSVEIPEGAMAFSFSSPFEQYFDHDVTIKQARLLVFSSNKTQIKLTSLKDDSFKA